MSTNTTGYTANSTQNATEPEWNESGLSIAFHFPYLHLRSLVTFLTEPTRLATLLGEAFRDARVAQHELPRSPFEGEGISVKVDVMAVIARLEATRPSEAPAGAAGHSPERAVDGAETRRGDDS